MASTSEGRLPVFNDAVGVVTGDRPFPSESAFPFKFPCFTGSVYAGLPDLSDRGDDEGGMEAAADVTEFVLLLCANIPGRGKDDGKGGESAPPFCTLGEPTAVWLLPLFVNIEVAARLNLPFGLTPPPVPRTSELPLLVG
jgi:hypothetical protein